MLHNLTCLCFSSRVGYTRGSTPLGEPQYILCTAHGFIEHGLFEVGDLGLADGLESEKPLERELAAIRLACLWLIYAADRLWENVNGRDNNGKDVGCGKRFQSGKWKGFSRDRWSFWEERLLEAKVIYTSGEAKELIEDALAQMKRASTE